MNNILASLKIALRAMSANKGRTALTVLGITIGIMSVIIVYSAGAGIRGLLVGQLEAFGTNIIQVEIKVPTMKKGSSGDTQSSMALASGVQVTTLKLQDMNDIKKIANISDCYGALMSQDLAGYGNEQRKVSLFGVSPSYLNIDKSQIAQGDFFTASDEDSLAEVVVLGSKIKTNLFGDSDAIGRYITLHKSKYKVIGIMKSRGATFGMDLDSYVYVPLRTLQKKVMGLDHMMYMICQLKDNNSSGDTAEQVKSILRINHNISNPDRDDFRVSTMDDMMKTLNTVTDALTWLLLAIVAISLVVGGVGILNIMYVIVSERTAEIGLRKAVGANYKNIMVQFLVEAVLITFIGAVAGIVLGILFSALIALGANKFGFDWQFSIPLTSIIVALVFAFACGLGFGVYPAKRAAKLDPIEALRRE